MRYLLRLAFLLSYCFPFFLQPHFVIPQLLRKKEAKLSTYASLSDTVKYVGMNTCRKCHESIYETFIQTGMGKSFDLASHKKSSAKFDTLP